jgi:hypothetical protein
MNPLRWRPPELRSPRASRGIEQPADTSTLAPAKPLQGVSAGLDVGVGIGGHNQATARRAELTDQAIEAANVMARILDHVVDDLPLNWANQLRAALIAYQRAMVALDEYEQHGVG